MSKEGLAKSEEGCLSLPGIREVVKRAEKVVVTGLDENGKKIRIEADDLLAICLQHEIDHLDGILIIDRLSKLKRELLSVKLKKQTKQQTKLGDL